VENLNKQTSELLIELLQLDDTSALSVAMLLETIQKETRGGLMANKHD